MNMNRLNGIEKGLNPDLISFKELSFKENISHTDIILSIIELSINKAKYKHISSPCSSKFWRFVYSNEYLNHIFGKISQDTIRKYWMKIEKCKSIEYLIDLQLSFGNLLNNPGKTLFATLSICIEFVDRNLEKEKFPAFYRLKINSNKRNRILSREEKELQKELMQQDDLENEEKSNIIEKDTENKEENEKPVVNDFNKFKGDEKSEEEKQNEQEEQDSSEEPEEEEPDNLEIDNKSNGEAKIDEILNGGEKLSYEITHLIANEVSNKFKAKIFSASNIKKCLENMNKIREGNNDEEDNNEV